jgi:glycosyltransferase involved in cell wall biosynthesis
MPEIEYKIEPKKFKNSISILYLVNSILPINICGYTIRTEEVISSLQKNSINICVVHRLLLANTKVKDKYYQNNIQYYVLKTNKTMRVYSGSSIYSPEYLDEYSFQLEKFCKAYKPDLIHACSNYINPLVASRISKKLNIPCIYEIRGFWDLTRLSYDPLWEQQDSFKEYSNFEYEAYKSVNYILTLNNQIKNEIINLGIDRNKFLVVPNGVNINKWIPSNININLSKKFNPFNFTVFGYIGSTVEYEGIELLVYAANELKKNNKQFKLLIIGKGNTDNALITYNNIESLINKFNLHDCVKLIGQIDPILIPKYYSIIDIVCIPRLDKSVCELVTPIKIFEAMSMQKLLIVSDVNPLKEIINHGVTGIIHKKNNYKDLYTKMLYCINNQNIIKQISINSRDYVTKYHQWYKITDEIYKLYIKLIKNVITG